MRDDEHPTLDEGLPLELQVQRLRDRVGRHDQLHDSAERRFQALENPDPDRQSQVHVHIGLGASIAPHLRKSAPGMIGGTIAGTVIAALIEVVRNWGP